jgi:hypothetical protein
VACLPLLLFVVILRITLSFSLSLSGKDLKRQSLQRKEYVLYSKPVTSTTEVTWGSKTNYSLEENIH